MAFLRLEISCAAKWHRLGVSCDVLHVCEAVPRPVQGLPASSELSMLA